MIRLFALIAITLMNSCTMKGKDNKMIFTIDFQDFFELDVVTFKIDNCVIFKDLVLTSDESIGLTSVQVSLDEKAKGLILLYDENSTSLERKLGDGRKKKVIHCEFDKVQKEYVVEILLNGKLNLFRINLDKGKYIGFDKIEGNNLKLHQSELPFEYD